MWIGVNRGRRHGMNISHNIPRLVGNPIRLRLDLDGVAVAGKGGANAPPFGGSNVFLYITARVHRTIMQQWNASAITRHSYTLT